MARSPGRGPRHVSVVIESREWHPSVVKRPILAQAHSQMATRIARCTAVGAYLVIVHFLLLHTLHLVTGPDAPTPHQMSAGTTPAQTSGSSADPAGADASCSAPAFVTQRFEIPLSHVEPGAFTVIVCDAPSPPTFLVSETILPRPPGPDRQAILQRFTL